jgi:hypothetical protein
MHGGWIEAFQTKLAELNGEPAAVESGGTTRPMAGEGADGRARNAEATLALVHPAARRIRDKDHLKFVATQPCLICGRIPTDPHHLRFADRRALGRKVSDEHTVPLCRGHHRELHRHGNESVWWSKIGIEPTATARELWLQTHPLRP